MNALTDLIQRCHQRHNKPLRQQKTVALPSMYTKGMHTKGYVYQYTVYCANSYPVMLDDLEAAEISIMPIGRAPTYDNGQRSFDDSKFLRRQVRQSWDSNQWDASWGLQVFTGIPSERDGARWHDLHFTYEAISAAPDAVFACIETLVSAVRNPLLTMTASGGLRFSCRVPDYLHPDTAQERLYIYKHTPTAENPHQRDAYLEIIGEKGHTRWDGRYEILLGNLLEPPIIPQEVLFAPVNALRAALHKPAPLGADEIEITTPMPRHLGTPQLNQATGVFAKRGFSYIRQDDGFHYWSLPGGKPGDAHVLLWENEGTVWIQASTPDAGLPMEARPITDVWDDTGILPTVPVGGLPVSDKILAVRQGKRSPLSIRRRPPVLQKPEDSQEVYETFKEKAVETQRIFDGSARILGLICETNTPNFYEIESYLLNSGATSLNVPTLTSAEETLRRCQERNMPSIARWKPRMYRWDAVKDIPVDVRMAKPFQYGNVCEDPERCDALKDKGGNPRESICPQCPVYTECQARGYLSQPVTLQRAKTQISTIQKLFLAPYHAEIVEEILEQTDDTERLCIINEAKVDTLPLRCRIPKDTLEEWIVNWQGFALGNFAKTLLHTLQITEKLHSDAVKGIRTMMKAFEWQEEEIIKQMCQVNVAGKVVERGAVDAETGAELAHFTIEFETGTSAYIPIDTNAEDMLRANGLPIFQLRDSVLNEDIKIPMSITEAIGLGIFDTQTVENIEHLPTVCPDPNWTYWHLLKHFFAHYTRDADTPILWDATALIFWSPPVLYESVKRLLLTSPTLSEQHLRKVFPNDEIEIIRAQPTDWLPDNQVFQIRTGIYTRQTILDYTMIWERVGFSKTGENLLLDIRAEIERDPSVKHAIITDTRITPLLTGIAENENVCLVTNFKNVEASKTAIEAAEVIWIVGTPEPAPKLIWQQARILFGNDEEPLNYERDTKSGYYKDERIQSIHDEFIARILTETIKYVGLDRFPGKKVVLISSLELPGITDRPETLLFDWEDFQVAGRLDKLAEVIATRQRFENEKANLTAEFSTEEVMRILGCSRVHANRVLYDLRGGKIRQVSFSDQILSLLTSGGEKKTREIVAAIDGHPKAIDNELRKLVNAGEIVRVRWGVYARKTEAEVRQDT